MEKTEKVVVSASALIASLLCYSYARALKKEAAPYLMVGAFLGTLIGETFAERLKSSQE